MNKILLACPVSEYKNYILPHWLTRVKELRKVYPFDVLLVDNSPDKFYHRGLYKYINATIIRRPQLKNETLAETMAECNNIINAHLQKKKYDYLFSLECDVFPPVDVLPKLLAHQKEIVSACYNIGHGPDRTLMVQQLILLQNQKSKIINVLPEHGFNLIDGTLKQVYACGLGCILISTETLKNYNFRVEKELIVHADTFFHFDMNSKNIPVYLDTSIICTHVNSHWNSINQKNGNKFRK